MTTLTSDRPADLRQDMLTLQVMRIMDSIWKKEGMDFLLNLYNCLPMGKNVHTQYCNSTVVLYLCMKFFRSA